MLNAVGRFLCLLALSACSTVSDERRCALPPGMAGWSQAWAEKNEPAFEVLYTQSAIFQPPAGEPIRGASAIAARLSRGFDQMLVEFEREQISDGCSELYELGRFVDRRRLDRSVIATGRYLVIWKNVDGAWRIEHHAYSSAQ